MNVGLGWYSPGQSWLHRLDPRPKLAFVLLANVALVSQRGLVLPLLFLAFVHVCLASARVPWRRVAQLWRILAPLLTVVVLLQPLLSPAGEPLVTFWIVRVTTEGVTIAVSLALRLAALGFSWYLLLLTTREKDLVPLVRLGLPSGWGMTVALALRYPATLGEVYTSVLEAQQARGLRLEGRGLLGRARAQLPVLIAMMVMAVRSIEQIAMALEARGFGASTRRTSLMPLQLRAADWLALGVITVAAAGLIGARLTGI
jgi:energy-coupling factor transport system permease protein